MFKRLGEWISCGIMENPLSPAQLKSEIKLAEKSVISCFINSTNKKNPPSASPGTDIAA
jgi:hypothetical protein